MSVASPLDNSAILLDQGGQWSIDLRLTQGQPVQLASLADNSAVTSCDHCLEVGDCISIGTLDNKCTEHYLYADVTTIVSTTQFEFTVVSGDRASNFNSGFVTKTIDLTGFGLIGQIASRNPNEKSPPNLAGCIALGDNRLLIADEADVVVGDTVTLAAAGLTAVQVTGVYTSSSTTGTGFSQSTTTQTILCLASNASATIDCSAPQSFTRSGAVIANMTFTYPQGAKYGHVRATIPVSELIDFPAIGDGCGCGDYNKIGCYEILLFQGYFPPNSNYSRSAYISWSKSLARGPAFMRSSFVYPTAA